MTKFVFDPPPIPALPILGDEALLSRRPHFLRRPQLRRSCARNGPCRRPRKAVLFLQKRDGAARSPARRCPIRRARSNYHFEMELVVAIGAPAFKIAAAEALERRVRLRLRPRHDAARPAAFRARQAAALDARQGCRGKRAGLGDRAAPRASAIPPKARIELRQNGQARQDLRPRRHGVVGSRNHRPSLRLLSSRRPAT